jgi:hypothetical protein
MSPIIGKATLRRPNSARAPSDAALRKRFMKGGLASGAPHRGAARIDHRAHWLE